MNIAFFLTPKKDVAYETVDSTMRQVIERMEYHHYTAVPILDEEGHYVGTITEGDLLRKLKNTPGLDFSGTSKVLVSDIPTRTCNRPVHITCNIEDLFNTTLHQNFVPVLDDMEKFIGIIKRSAIIEYCFQKMYHRQAQA